LKVCFDLEVCSHCRRSFRVKVSDDIGFYFHWVSDYYCIDVVLFVDGVCSVLYGMVFVAESGKHERRECETANVV